MHIAFIGFGEAGRAFQKTLGQEVAGTEFSAFDLLLDKQGASGACAQAMRDAGVQQAATPAAAASKADWIISAVTADQSRIAAEQSAPHLGAGQFFLDINSVSPERKRSNALAVEKGGARYIDMAVMAPVHPKGHKTPVLIAGPACADIKPELERFGFSFDVAGEQIGAATAIKMVRSLFVKGLEALTVEALIAAEASGCLEQIRQSLSKSYAGLGWPEFADYEFERTLKHGKRRAAEMRECAATLNDLGLYGALADAVAEVQERMGALGPQGGDAPLAEMLPSIARQRRGQPG